MYKNLTVQYFRRAHCALVVYDVTRRETFENLEKYIHKLDENCPEDTVKLLIGCKTDLRPVTVFSQMDDFVTTDEAEKFAKQLNLKYIEVSLLEPEPIIEKTFELIFKSCTQLMKKRCLRQV